MIMFDPAYGAWMALSNVVVTIIICWTLVHIVRMLLKSGKT